MLVLSVPTVFGALGTTAWPMFRHDLQHTGRSEYSGPSTVNEKWNFVTGNWVRSSPAIGPDGTIYVGSSDGNLYAINSDGILKWKYFVELPVESSPTISLNDMIYIGADGLFVFDKNGTLMSRFTTAAIIQSSAAISVDGTVYVGSDDKRIYALSSQGATGTSVTTTTTTPIPEFGNQSGSAMISLALALAMSIIVIRTLARRTKSRQLKGAIEGIIWAEAERHAFDAADFEQHF